MMNRFVLFCLFSVIPITTAATTSTTTSSNNNIEMKFEDEIEALNVKIKALKVARALEVLKVLNADTKVRQAEDERKTYGTLLRASKETTSEESKRIIDSNISEIADSIVFTGSKKKFDGIKDGTIKIADETQGYPWSEVAQKLDKFSEDTTAIAEILAMPERYARRFFLHDHIGYVQRGINTKESKFEKKLDDEIGIEKEKLYLIINQKFLNASKAATPQDSKKIIDDDISTIAHYFVLLRMNSQKIRLGCGRIKNKTKGYPWPTVAQKVIDQMSLPKKK